MSAEPTGRVVVRVGLRPGDIGAITHLHGMLYAAERGWDHTFEAYVAGPLAEFAIRGDAKERIWVAEHDGRVAGCIAIVEADSGTAQLRWFLLHPSLRGRGLGRDLVAKAVEFCRRAGYRSVYLWTVKGLDAAAKLYAEAGFELTEESTHSIWGAVVCEQRYDLLLQPGDPGPAAADGAQR